MRTVRWMPIVSVLLAGLSAFLPVSVRAEDDFFDFFNPYGSLRAHLAFCVENVEVQNNRSRLGLDMSTDTRRGWRFIARGEWGVNLVKNEKSFGLIDDDLGLWMDFESLGRKN